MRAERCLRWESVTGEAPSHAAGRSIAVIPTSARRVGTIGEPGVFCPEGHSLSFWVGNQGVQFL
jgi:hypothetical protein